MLRLLTKESFRNSAVSVWNGAWWDGVTDGSKRCYGCGSHYKLNVVSERASRRNALQAPRDDSIVLITKDVGFRFAYLRQFWTWMCRASESAEAEAATIMMVHPSAMIGNAKCNDWGTSRKVSEVKGFARILFRAVCVYLSLANKEYNFDVFDSVPDDDPRFGMPNKGQHMQYMLAGGLAKDYLSNLQSVLCNDFILLM